MRSDGRPRLGPRQGAGGDAAVRSGVITSALLVATGMAAVPILPGAVAEEPDFTRRARFATGVVVPLAAPRAPSAEAGGRAGPLADGDGADVLEPDRDERRVYLSGMLGVGTSAAAAPPAAVEPPSPLLAGTLFGGDGAVGISAPRPWGAARVECEARGRMPARPGADQRWAVLANVWHDVGLTDRLAIYGGGGAGPGGTRGGDGAATAPAGLAWQVGAGIAYDLSERLTLDVGYRHGGIESGASRGGVPASGEAVIAVRLHDPFRGWWERRGAPRGDAAAGRRGGG